MISNSDPSPTDDLLNKRLSIVCDGKLLSDNSLYSYNSQNNLRRNARRGPFRSKISAIGRPLRTLVLRTGETTGERFALLSLVEKPLFSDVKHSPTVCANFPLSRSLSATSFALQVQVQVQVQIRQTQQGESVENLSSCAAGKTETAVGNAGNRGISQRTLGAVL